MATATKKKPKNRIAETNGEPETNGHDDKPLPTLEHEASELSRLERDHYEEIRRLEIKVRELDGIHQERKAMASAAKKNFEAADLELRTATR